MVEPWGVGLVRAVIQCLLAVSLWNWIYNKEYLICHLWKVAEVRDLGRSQITRKSLI